MYHVWLNGKILKGFKKLECAKLFALKYLIEHKNLSDSNDVFNIASP